MFSIVKRTRNVKNNKLKTIIHNNYNGKVINHICRALSYIGTSGKSGTIFIEHDT